MFKRKKQTLKRDISIENMTCFYMSNKVKAKMQRKLLIFCHLSLRKRVYGEATSLIPLRG